MFKKKQLSVKALEVTQQVLIEDVQDLNEDQLCLHVERAGIEVEKILFSEDEQSAILTLSDHKGKGLSADMTLLNSYSFTLQCEK